MLNVSFFLFFSFFLVLMALRRVERTSNGLIMLSLFKFNVQACKPYWIFIFNHQH